MTVPPRRCLILANPKAGALSRYAAGVRWRERLARALGREEKHDPVFGVPPSLELLTDAAANAGVVAEVEVAPPIAQLPQRFREAARSGIDTVVAVGGDGTVRAFAQALLNQDLRDLLTLGILPLGTANNVAHSLHIPFDLDGAMRVLAEGIAQGMDVGQVGGEYFLEAAGVGLFADAVQAFGTEEVRALADWPGAESGRAPVLERPVAHTPAYARRCDRRRGRPACYRRQWPVSGRGCRVHAHRGTHGRPVRRYHCGRALTGGVVRVHPRRDARRTSAIFPMSATFRRVP